MTRIREQLLAWLDCLRSWIGDRAGALELNADAETHFLDGPIGVVYVDDAAEAIERLTTSKMPSIWFGPFVPTRRKLAELHPHDPQS